MKQIIIVILLIMGMAQNERPHAGSVERPLKHNAGWIVNHPK